MTDRDSQIGPVLGIDPGTRRMGWAVLLGGAAGGFERLASGTLVPTAKAPLHERLGLLLVELQILFDDHSIAVLAIESAFVHKNPHTALALGQARGLPIAIAAAKGLPVYEYAPALVKKHIVGSGRASKMQVRQMIRLVLKEDQLPPEDEADAIAVALSHLREQASPLTQVRRAIEPGREELTQAGARYAALLQSAGGGKGRRRHRRRS